MDLVDWNICRSSAVRTYNQGSDQDNYASKWEHTYVSTVADRIAEHMLELESIPMFIKWAAMNQDVCKEIDCLFFAGFFNKKVLDSPPDMPGLDASHQQVPMQRVMESLGSETNAGNFTILWGSNNLNKAQVRCPANL